MVGALSDRGLLFEGIKAFAGPRRLTLAIAGLPAKQKDVREELKGPKVDAPQAALEGFLKKTGLTKDQLKVEKTPKGDVYIAVIERNGPRDAACAGRDHSRSDGQAALAEIHALEAGPDRCAGCGRCIPSSAPSMAKWCRSASPASPAAMHTRGHRFLSQGKIEVRRFDDYEAEAAQGACRAGRRGAQGHHLRRRQAGGLRAWPGNDPGRGAAGRSRRPGGMAGGADRHHRGPVHGCAGGDPADLHAHASEIFQPARSQDRQDGQPLRPGRQHDRRGRRQGNRRRQRARAARAPVGRQILLGRGPQAHAGKPGRRPQGHRLPRQAGHPV